MGVAGTHDVWRPLPFLGAESFEVVVVASSENVKDELFIEMGYLMAKVLLRKIRT